MNNYIRQIVRQLKCSKVKKEEIRKQLTADYQAAAESGDSDAQIQARLGSVKEIVEAFNNSFPEEEARAFLRQKRLRILLSVVIILAAAVCLLYWNLPRAEEFGKSGHFSADEVIAQTEQIIDLMDQKDYDALMACSTESMQTVFADSATLEAGMAQIAEDFGSRQGLSHMYLTEVRQRGTCSATVQVNASYENASVTYTISFSEDMKLQGLWMK